MYEPEDKIENLQKSLYSREGPTRKVRRSVFGIRKNTEVPTDWEHPKEDDDVNLNQQYKKPGMSFFTKLFIGSLIFFIIALGVGGFLLFQGSNIVSANNIDIAIAGPVSIGGGELLSFDVQVYNRNNIVLQAVDLNVEFPPGTTAPGGDRSEYRRHREMMGDIQPGAYAKKTVQSILFGEENSKKILTVRIEYRIPGSNATFTKEKTYEILISSAPLTVTIDSFREINSGQEIELTVNIISNSDQVLSGLALRAEYPFGFVYKSSSIRPVSETTLWRIGDIPPKAKRSMTIIGTVEGQDDEERVFRFNIGNTRSATDANIGTLLLSNQHSVVVKKAFLATTLSLDSDSGKGDFIGNFDTPIQATVSWFNNLPISVIDGEIRVKFGGNAYSKLAISPEQGFFRSAENEIVWNKLTTNELSSIGPGESGKVTFRLIPKDTGSNIRPIIEPTVTMDVSVKANRIGESNVPTSITSSVTRSVKVAGLVDFVAQATRGGSLADIGTVPPKAEAQTSYNIVWTINTTSSSIRNGIVTVTLPPFVTYSGKHTPITENISYNSVNNTLTWNVGDVPSYAGTINNSKQIAFQIVIEPGVNLIGQIPTIINPPVFKGIEAFTGKEISVVYSRPVTTLYSGSGYVNGHEFIIK